MDDRRPNFTLLALLRQAQPVEIILIAFLALDYSMLFTIRLHPSSWLVLDSFAIGQNYTNTAPPQAEAPSRRSAKMTVDEATQTHRPPETVTIVQQVRNSLC